MKKSIQFLFCVLVLTATLLSACGGAPSVASPAGPKVEAAEVAFTGVIEAMSGTQWIVNGQAITVDPAIVQDGPFAVGDTIQVEARVSPDGSVTVTRVEAPTSGGLVGSVPPGADNTNSAGTQSGLILDDSGDEAFGTVEAITTDTIIISGQAFTIANGAEFKNQIAAGDFVKVHFVVNPDGTLSITEIETWDPALVGNDNSNFNDNTNDDNSNDDDDNSNDDNSNDDDDNSNDDDDDDNSNGDD